MLIAGIEEAGRGPAIGPMIICIVLIEESLNPELVEWGVKDSKMLTPKTRKTLYDILTAKLDYKTVIVTPKEIDECLSSRISNLNWLEADKMAELTDAMLQKHDISKIIIDCPSHNINKYRDYYKRCITQKKSFKIICEHKADINYPVVSSASIIAKVQRDEIIETLKKQYNIDFGSGYTSDTKTKTFLKEYYRKNKRFPDFVRKKWQTIDDIVRDLRQKKLDLYLK
jgi:ribonuclease HII